MRSVILGLLGAAFVCSYTYFNDWIMRQTMFVGNFMPISVYGLLVLFLAVGVPLWRKLTKRGGLQRKELAVILVLTLVSCAIPGANLLRLFSPALIMPHRYERTEPGWKQQEVMKLVPDGMLRADSRMKAQLLDGYTRGAGEGVGQAEIQRGAVEGVARSAAVLGADHPEPVDRADATPGDDQYKQ